MSEPTVESLRPPSDVRLPRPRTVLSLLCALLLIALVADWRNSRRRGETLLLRTPRGFVQWNSAAGKVQLQFSTLGPYVPLGWDLTRGKGWFGRSGAVVPPDNTRYRGGGLIDWRLLGITFRYARVRDTSVALTVPHVWLVAVLAILPARWVFLRARRSHYLKRLGLCGRCGYDLRASTGRCPECGAPIAA